MFHTVIELPTACLAIAEIGTATRTASRAAYAQLIDELSRREPGRPLSVSKSHSGHWVAVGVSSVATIGVDIEVAGPRLRLAEMAEWLELDAANESEFFAHWTLRESLAKSRGGSVLESHAVESELRAAARQPGDVIDVNGYSALCGQVEGGIYYSLVLKHPARHETILCA